MVYYFFISSLYSPLNCAMVQILRRPVSAWDSTSDFTKGTCEIIFFNLNRAYKLSYLQFIKKETQIIIKFDQAFTLSDKKWYNKLYKLKWLLKCTNGLGRWLVWPRACWQTRKMASQCLFCCLYSSDETMDSRKTPNTKMVKLAQLDIFEKWKILFDYNLKFWLLIKFSNSEFNRNWFSDISLRSLHHPSFAPPWWSARNGQTCNLFILKQSKCEIQSCNRKMQKMPQWFFRNWNYLMKFSRCK